MKKNIYLIALVLMFCFDACNDKQSIRSIESDSDDDSPNAPRIPSVGGGGSGLEGGGDKGDVHEGASAAQNEKLTLKVGDIIELVSANRIDNSYTFTFKNDNNGQVNTVTVPIKPNQRSIDGSRDGQYLGTLEGHKLHVYAFYGDGENTTTKGQIYFRVSTDGIVRDQGDFMMFKADLFKKGTIKKGDPHSPYGGLFFIDLNGIVKKTVKS
jgi:hypothetical protein